MSGKKRKIFNKKDKLRVRKSYYTFSREYPKYIEVEKTGKRITASSVRRALMYFALFIAIVSASFFTMRLAINISYAPITSEQQETTDPELNGKISAEGIRALYMPYEKMDDRDYINDLIRQIKRKNGNSVVIDFKTAEGRLCYTSFQENAIAASAAIYDNDMVREALSLFAEKDIAVIARIFCFSDSRVAQAVSDAAVKYMGTQVNWLDGSDDEGGSPWLNPYSGTARDYIAEVAREISSFGVGIFILENLQFPDTGSSTSATYPGEKSASERNAMLKKTLSAVKKALPENALVILSQSAQDAADGNESIYYGTMSDADYYGIAVNTAQRPLSVAVDKKTDYISILSMYSSIAGRFAGKELIPVIDTQEYSYSYFRAMKKSGYGSFILFNENGEY